jgi:hypothetical protein
MTQDWAATIGHIVMERIVSPDCEESDAEMAVQWLFNVPDPNSIPGLVGGGLIVHLFLRMGISFHLPLGW